MAKQDTGEKTHLEKHPAKHPHHGAEAIAPQHTGSPAHNEIKIAIPAIKGLNLANFTIFVAVLLLIIVLFQAMEARTLSSKLDEMKSAALEASRPPAVQITAIEAETCKQCAPITGLLSAIISNTKLKITKSLTLPSSDAHSQKLIADYAIKKLPTIVITGEVDKVQLADAGFTKVKDALVYTTVAPPYLDTTTNKITGITQVVLLNDSNCPTCYDANLHVSILKGLYRIYLQSVRTVDVNSNEGKALVAKYNIEAVPTFLLSGDVASYDTLRAVWPTVGTVESDGTYIFRTMSAISGRPYMNLTSGQVEKNSQ